MNTSRRHFLQAAGAASSLAAGQAARAQGAPQRSANDQIQIATIGCGGMGSGDTRMAISLPGVRLVAVADIYDGRRERAREVWGKDIFTTRDYREILARSDIDAIIIGTPDHWHAQISIDAMNAGKHVYCEKPMTHTIEEAQALEAKVKAAGIKLQVGVQAMSDDSYETAYRYVKQGALGKVVIAQID